MFNRLLAGVPMLWRHLFLSGKGDHNLDTITNNLFSHPSSVERWLAKSREIFKYIPFLFFCCQTSKTRMCARLEIRTGRLAHVASRRAHVASRRARAGARIVGLQLALTRALRARRARPPEVPAKQPRAQRA